MKTPSPELRAELVSALINWLEGERAKLAKSWADEGLSATVSVERVLARRSYERVAERRANWYFHFSQETIEVPRSRMMTGLSVWWKSTTSAPGDLFVDAYGEDSVESGVLDETVNPGEGPVAAFLGRLCGDFLNGLDDVNSSAPDVAALVVDSYLKFVESDEITEFVTFPFGGVIAPAEAVDAADVGISVRGLTSEELGELNKEMFWPPKLGSAYCASRWAGTPASARVGTGVLHVDGLRAGVQAAATKAVVACSACRLGVTTSRISNLRPQTRRVMDGARSAHGFVPGTTRNPPVPGWPGDGIDQG